MKIQICVGFFSEQRKLLVIIDKSYKQVVDIFCEDQYAQRVGAICG